MSFDVNEWIVNIEIYYCVRVSMSSYALRCVCIDCLSMHDVRMHLMADDEWTLFSDFTKFSWLRF